MPWLLLFNRNRVFSSENSQAQLSHQRFRCLSSSILRGSGRYDKVSLFGPTFNLCACARRCLSLNIVVVTGSWTGVSRADYYRCAAIQLVALLGKFSGEQIKERINMTRPAFLTLAMHEQTLHVHFTEERADRSRSTEGAYRFNGTHVTSAREMISIRIFLSTRYSTHTLSRTR